MFYIRWTNEWICIVTGIFASHCLGLMFDFWSINLICCCFFHSYQTNVGLYWEINRCYFHTQLSQFTFHIHPPVKLSLRFRMYYLINKHNTYICTLELLCYTSTHSASVPNFGTGHPVLMWISKKKCAARRRLHLLVV